jgi:alkylation response protein AidB-like acyl-CoA dehydrogenase
MDFTIPENLSKEMEGFEAFLRERLQPKVTAWYEEGAVPRSFHAAMGEGGWLGFEFKENRLTKFSALRGALVAERLAALSPGVAVATLAHVDLGLIGLWLFGSDHLKRRYGESATRGETLLCLGNTETGAGSDVAGISMSAEKSEGGWLLNGTKAYVTNGFISDMAIFTAVSDPQAARNNRLSMFLVDLNGKGVTRKKLHKQVWIPSDLTRIKLENVFVPEDHLLGKRGRGLQQVLTIFTHSRVPISALTLGTASGAFETALDHAQRRKIFGKSIVQFQAKDFEIADFYARMESTRLMLWRACWAMDRHEDFRLDASMAKYLAVMVAREVTAWAADLFGAVSVMFEHPIHKFPMDAWASSLGEGTQDVQKLVIFREVMKRYGKGVPSS